MHYVPYRAATPLGPLGGKGGRGDGRTDAGKKGGEEKRAGGGVGPLGPGIRRIE